MKKTHKQIGKNRNPLSRVLGILEPGIVCRNWKFSFLFLLSSLIISSFFSVANAAESKWVTNFTDCGTTYMSIDCEADQYVCGYDGILHCSTPDEVEKGKKDIEGSININSGLGGGLVLDCAAASSSCLPWQCQTDTSCDAQKRSTKCLEKGSFECGECKAGYLNCDSSNPDCETTDNGSAGSHARNQGCDKIVCDAGYLDCNGNKSDGCEIQAGGSCDVSGNVGTYGQTCNGTQPPTCNVFAQQFATVQDESGQTVASKLQVDENGNVNIPVGAKFMVGGVAIGGTQTKECSSSQVKLGTECVSVPQCEFLKFEGNSFACAQPPKAETPIATSDCQNGQIRIGSSCQPVPTCELLRFDGQNGKFLCATASTSVATGTEASLSEEQVVPLVEQKFTELAVKLENDFGQMLTSVQQQVAAGLESGKVVAVAGEVSKVSIKDEPGKKTSWFNSVTSFFKNLFQ